MKKKNAAKVPHERWFIGIMRGFALDLCVQHAQNLFGAHMSWGRMCIQGINPIRSNTMGG